MDELENITKVLFIHQVRMKLFHFQTERYHAHKAVDKYLDKFASLFDKLIEVGRGAFGGRILIPFSLDVDIIADDNVLKELKNFIARLRSSSLEEFRELATIIDEMMSNAQQLKYLLGFQ